MIKLLAPLLLCVAVTGCATTPTPEPVVETIEVAVPVPVSCVPENLGEPETYSDTDEALVAADDGAERYRLLAIGRSQRNDRLGALETVVRGCREVGND